MKPRIQALSTHAYENIVGVVMANPNGANCGNSCAYSPICWDRNDREILIIRLFVRDNSFGRAEEQVWDDTEILKYEKEKGVLQ